MTSHPLSLGIPNQLLSRSPPAPTPSIVVMYHEEKRKIWERNLARNKEARNRKMKGETSR
jgi:hypothetical protein